MAQPVITVVGSSNTDLVVHAPHIPAPGETLLGSDFQRLPGGKGANQAVAAQRIGAETHLIARLGADELGEAALATLGLEGLRLDHVERLPGVASGVALIVVASSGENVIVVAPGANALLTAEDVARAATVIQASQMLIAQLEIPLETARRALSIARVAHAPTLLNPAPAQPLPDDLLALVDILVANESEAAALTAHTITTPADAQTAAQALRQRGPLLVIVTLGAAGCVIATPDVTTHIPAFSVPVVDTTAAGDAFIGALAVRLALGDAPETAARYASAAAALSVTHPGAQPSLPTGAQVAAFLASES